MLEGLESRRLLSAGLAVWADARPPLGPKAFAWGEPSARSAAPAVLRLPAETGSRPLYVLPTVSPLPPRPVVGDVDTPDVARDDPPPSPFPPPASSSLIGGALSGRVIYLTGGHGLNATAGVDGVWRTDRGLTNGLVEDFGNQDQLQPFADYILRAGGMVAALRPIGFQPLEVVLDNDSPEVTWGGSWSNVTTGLHYDEDEGATPDAVRFRFASINTSTETAWAMYAPTFPAAGFYPVYTWVTSGSNRALQTYQVLHSGGTTEVHVDHRLVGRGWVYLGTYHFDAGGGLGQGVRITNRSPSGTIVVADAIRFGNGMGDWNPGTGLSGRPREDEAGLYWILRSLGTGGGSTRVPSYYLTGSSDANSNITAQPKFAADMNSAPLGHALYLSFHSNAGGGRGAIALTHSSSPTPNQSRLALLIGREINEDLRSLQSQLGVSWSTRTTYTLAGAYGEINAGNLGSSLDGTIVEVAFHDDATDALVLRSPLGRELLARATYHAVVRYFAEFSGSPLQFAPSPPSGPRAQFETSGQLRLSWNPPPADAFSSGLNTNTGPYGFAPTAYEVQVSRNGLAFQTLATVTGTTYTLPAATLDDQPYYFRVVAVNDGGRSAPSPVAGTRKPLAGGATNPILIVQGFERFDQGLSPTETRSISFNPPSTGTPITYTRVRPRFSNSFDYVIQAGQAVADYSLGGVRLGFDSAWSGDVASGAVRLADYHTVVWLSGEESTVHETFSDLEQTLVSGYIGAGGRLFVSGAEIGWDLDRPSGPSSSDRAFYNGTLRTRYVADAANTYTVAPVGGGIFAGLGNLSFDSRDTLYDAEFADVIAPATGSGAVTALTYVGGSSPGGGAAVAWAGPNPAGTPGGGRVVNFGFPFETLRTPAARSAVMARVLDFFQTASAIDAQPPAVTAVVINDGSPQRSGVREVTVSFSEAVSLASGAFVLTRRADAGGGAVSPSVSATNPSGDQRTWRLTFSGPGTTSTGGLIDGIYDLTVVGNKVLDAVGNAMAGNLTTTFHRLFGDLNGDRRVDSADVAAFSAVFGSTQASAGPAFAWWADADDNGAVNNADLLQLRNRLGVVYVY
ncbi:MAG: dockerin type I domain-containing protein [Tepidisphaerales bacterium]